MAATSSRLTVTAASARKPLRQLLPQFAASVLGIVFFLLPFGCHGFSASSPSSSSSPTRSSTPSSSSSPPQPKSSCYPFSIPLLNKERPKPKGFIQTLNQLWNDPRPVSTSVGDVVFNNNNNLKNPAEEEEEFGSSENENNNDKEDDSSTTSSIPYCIISDEFMIQEKHKFRILLYPRGRFFSSDATAAKATTAAVYLRYIPNEMGDEIDVGWKLRLVDTRHNNTALPIITSGGLPFSDTTWSAAMTLCSEGEDLESLGRATDWGSSIWTSSQVCNALLGVGDGDSSSTLRAEGEITIFDSRTDESSFALNFPPRGALGAVWKASTSTGQEQRDFRVGEVIVPIFSSSTDDDDEQQRLLKEEYFIYPGTDYRIMTMTSPQDGGVPIFSTKDVPSNQRNNVKLALRPCGWKLQQQLWQNRGISKMSTSGTSTTTTTTTWPVEISVGMLQTSSTSVLSRFNLGSALPRVISTFQRDKLAVILGTVLALAPIPTTLIGRNFVSLYAIPTASMEPTLLKGDVLLVEKFPKVYEDRTHRGDIVLFKPPTTLIEMMAASSGGSSNSAISGNSLFVKRIVGMPGDANIVLDVTTGDVSVGGLPAVGPDRNLCDDEPLRLIDRYLREGKGANIAELGEDEVYVVGDCKGVSIDSRVFGTLPKQNIVGKPIGRIWPPSRITFGEL